MTPREQAQENFRTLQQQLQKRAFLRGAHKEDNPYTKATIDLVYHLMDRLGWPDEGWYLETKNKHFPGYFHDGTRSSVGVVVAAKILGRNLEFAVQVGFTTQPTIPHQILINNRTLGGIQETNGVWTIADSLLDVVRNEIIEIALNVPDESTAGA